jgi:hypothetical protein
MREARAMRAEAVRLAAYTGLRLRHHHPGPPVRGWHCRLAAQPIRCVSQRRLVTFVNGGDAG